MKEWIKKRPLIFKVLLKTYDFLIFLKITLSYFIFLPIFSLFRINNKKIIIMNFSGKWYWDMGKYISKELIIKWDYEIYWWCKEKWKWTIPDWIKYVEYDSLKYLYHLATAKIWINNQRFWYGIRKREKQFYIQAWHWCLAFKKVEAAVKDKMSKYDILSSKNDSKMADLFISNSKYCTNFYRKYFWYNGRILECWCPRNDIIINNDKDSILKVKRTYWIDLNDNICLYAPTFRSWYSLDSYNLDYKVLISLLRNKFKWNRKLLIRLHPNISYLSNQLSWIDKDIINATDYPDMQELLVATDFLVTDYSSCILDYALSGKMWMIYASDIDDYKNDRDFDIKLEDTPFPIVRNNDELKNTIKEYNIKTYKDEIVKFYTNLWIKETWESSKIIANIINDITNDNSIDQYFIL